MESNDCEEALRTLFSKPDGQTAEEALSAGDIMNVLSQHGFRGRDFTANAIGKAMKQLGFESRVIRGTRKYLVVKIDPGLHDLENKTDARQFVPETF